MTQIKVPSSELERLQTLVKLQILDTDREPIYDLITKMVTLVMKSPISYLAMVDKDRYWAKSIVGAPNITGPRQYSFSAVALLTPQQPFVVEDTLLDPRFQKNPYVLGEPHTRFFVGIPVFVFDQPVGVLSAADIVPRKHPSKLELDQLKYLAKLTAQHMELREFFTEIYDSLEAFKQFPELWENSQALPELFKKADRVIDQIKTRKQSTQ